MESSERSLDTSHERDQGREAAREAPEHSQPYTRDGGGGRSRMFAPVSYF